MTTKQELENEALWFGYTADVDEGTAFLVKKLEAYGVVLSVTTRTAGSDFDACIRVAYGDVHMQTTLHSVPELHNTLWVMLAAARCTGEHDYQELQ